MSVTSQLIILVILALIALSVAGAVLFFNIWAAKIAAEEYPSAPVEVATTFFQTKFPQEWARWKVTLKNGDIHTVVGNLSVWVGKTHSLVKSYHKIR